MLMRDFESRLKDSRLDESYEDFGIYGDHLLFRTKSFEPNIGVFSDDQIIIGAYRAMYENAMGAASLLEASPGEQEKVSMEQFLNCDSLDLIQASE